MSEICILDREGNVAERKRAGTHAGALSEALRGYEGARVLMEWVRTRLN
jgi:hypothetical protein